MNDFDDEELVVAALHSAVAELVRSLDPALARLTLDAATLEQAQAYLCAVDATAVDVIEKVKSTTGQGFLYHAHEHLERHARSDAGALQSSVPLSAAECLHADRLARLAESKLEQLLCVWLLDEDVPWEHFLWTLCITGDASHFAKLDEQKSEAVAKGLGISRPNGIDRGRIQRIRSHLWNWNLTSLEHESTASLAYARWRMRKCHHGYDREDWFAAERAQQLLANPTLVEGSGSWNPWVL